MFLIAIQNMPFLIMNFAVEACHTRFFFKFGFGILPIIIFSNNYTLLECESIVLVLINNLSKINVALHFIFTS